ncbi:hypothetical protein P5673_032202 [Acropora cervicornis]|uniref:Uncharacterized protein n=1 Tax=Acropora cervicornis TaxID=6130 RepID=A0AAD9PS77_ACRCE|nr:hypothetical protein P5673_032202 [Acropora cervicornis]
MMDCKLAVIPANNFSHCIFFHVPRLLSINTLSSEQTKISPVHLKCSLLQVLQEVVLHFSQECCIGCNAAWWQ